MITENVVQALETVPELKNKVFPGGVCIDDIAPPMAVYVAQKSRPFRVLNGKIHHYTETVGVDFLAKTYDECHALYAAAEEAAYSLSQIPGIWGVEVSAEEPDAAMIDLDLVRRSMRITFERRP